MNSRRRRRQDRLRHLIIFLAALPMLSQTADEHSRQAAAYLRANQPDLAVKEFEAVAALDPNNLDARANAGVLEFFAGDYPKATPNLLAAVTAKPSLFKLQALLGMSEKRMGETAKAQADLEKAFPQLAEEKLKVQSGMELIEADYALNDLGKASDVVNALRQLRPEDPDILFTAHRVYADLSDETLLSLAMIAPDSARMHQLMAHELARQAKNDAAVTQYREALKIDPKLTGAHFELAEMLNTQSSAAAQAEAAKEYKAALAGNPFDEKSECRLGDIALRLSDPKDAGVHYTRALQIQPNDPEANLGLAKVLISQHQPKQAEAHLEQAARLEPFNPTTHYRLGVLYRQLGRSGDSQRELAEFEKLKKMKSRLADIYQEMRLQPIHPEQPDADVP